jgi:hypothetical protein
MTVYTVRYVETTCGAVRVPPGALPRQAASRAARLGARPLSALDVGAAGRAGGRLHRGQAGAKRPAAGC